jgi:ATP synthase protein I
MSKPQKNWAKSLGSALSMATGFAAAVGFGYYAGKWLDSRFHTAPYLMLLMILLGVATGIKMMYDWAFSPDTNDALHTADSDGEKRKNYAPSKEIISSLQETRTRLLELEKSREQGDELDQKED